jgi:hypothetical protein
MAWGQTETDAQPVSANEGAPRRPRNVQQPGERSRRYFIDRRSTRRNNPDDPPSTSCRTETWHRVCFVTIRLIATKGPPQKGIQFR